MITVTIILLYSLTLLSKQIKKNQKTHDHDIIMITGIMRTKNNTEER